MIIIIGSRLRAIQRVKDKMYTPKRYLSKPPKDGSVLFLCFTSKIDILSMKLRHK